MTPDRFLYHAGPIGQEILSHPWADSSLGPLDAWPPYLLFSLELCLGSPVPNAIVWGPEKLLLHNEAWRHWLGDHSLGRPLCEVWPTVWPHLEPLLDQVLNTGKGQFFQGAAPFRLAVSPLGGDGALLTAADVDSRGVWLEKALRVSEARYRTLFESIDEGVCVAEMIRDEAGRPVDYRFLDINPLFCPMTGLPEDAVGKTARELVPDLEQSWVDTYAKAALGGETIRFQSASSAMGRRFDVFATPVEPYGCFALVFKDITERSLAEEGQQRQSAQFETLLNQAPIGIFLIDDRFKVRHANPVARVVLGEAFHPVVGVDFTRMLEAAYPAEIASEFLATFQRTLDTGEPYFSQQRSEFRLDRQAVEHYEWWLVRTLLPEGGHAVICYFRDIGKDLEAGRKVDAAQRRFAAIFNQHSAGVCEVDSEGNFTLVNQRFADMVGYSRDELMAMQIHQLSDPDERSDVQSRLGSLLDGQSDYVIEKTWRRKDGEQIWINASVISIREDGYPLDSVISVVLDITERKRKERTLNFLVGLSATVQNLSEPDGITRATAVLLGEHLQAHRCAYAEVEEDQNHFTVPYDYTRGIPSMKGRYAMRQFGAEVLRQMRLGRSFIIDDVANDSRVDEDDRVTYSQTGIGSAICTPLHKGGRFVACMAVHQSEPRRWRADEIELVEMVVARCWESIERARTLRSLNAEIEEVKLAQQALRDADRRKDEFLAMLAHELRNPLAPIRTAVPLLLKGGSAAPRAATIIERQVVNMARLLDDLLDVSRITRGLIRVQVEKLDLSEVVAHAVEATRPFIESRGHQLHSHLQPGLWVYGDRLRLEQVAVNLLNNAAKYTDPGGTLEIGTAGHDLQAVLTVSDTGIGIPEDLLPHLFDLFAQGDRTIDRSQGGLGIGLTMVKGLVELQGGTVGVASAGANQGSRFTVRLPLIPPDPG